MLPGGSDGGQSDRIPSKIFDILTGLQVYKHRRLQGETSAATTSAHGNALRIRGVAGLIEVRVCVGSNSNLLCICVSGCVCLGGIWVR